MADHHVNGIGAAMKRRTIFSVLSVALALLASMALPATARAQSSDTYYVSLGDSLAAGYQPPYHRNSNSLRQGYADQLFRDVRADFDHLRLVKLGCGGETTRTLIKGARYCPFDSGSQLQEAVDFLGSHQGTIQFVTLDIGANDILDACWHYRSGVLNAECVDAVLPVVQANLETILSTLKSAAPGVPIYGMNYYDPFLGYWVLGPNGKPSDPQLAIADAKVWEVVNDAFASTYHANAVAVANVAGAFQSSVFDQVVPWKHVGTVPVSVANDCAWTWNCTTPPLGWDIHANSAGYGVIARAFADAINA